MKKIFDKQYTENGKLKPTAIIFSETKAARNEKQNKNLVKQK